jgi:hypothetical protein
VGGGVPNLGHAHSPSYPKDRQTAAPKLREESTSRDLSLITACYVNPESASGVYLSNTGPR